MPSNTNRILLVNLKEPFDKKQVPVYVPPIGLWSMRSVAHAFTKNKVDICDEHIGDCAESFLTTDYDIIGISAKFSIQHKEYIRVAKTAWWYGKKMKWAQFSTNKSLIVSGGFHASAVEKPKYVDYVIKGDGEKFILGYKNDYYDFDDYPHPEFSMYEMHRYWNKKAPHDLESKTDRWMPIETSRGCNKRCNFCGVPNFWGNWRPHSVEWMERYVKYIKERGIKEVFIEDYNISIDKKRFIKLIDLFKENDIYWSTPNGIQASTIRSKEVINALDKSTCWKLSLPFETGTEKGRDLMNLGSKWLPFDKAFDLVLSLNDIGIKTTGFFVIGYPGETTEDIKRTLYYANNLPLDGRHIHIAIPYPGTPLYELCKKEGYLLSEGKKLYKDLLCSNGLIETEEFNPTTMEQIRKKDRDEAIKRKALLHEGSISV